MDWSPVTNLLVTCSQDRNAYVWELQGTTWKPSLVMLRINRAATCVRWSPDGKKFAVASGSKTVPVCQYDKQGDWWISRMIRRNRSTVVDVAWSPCGHYLATASTDRRCCIVSAFVPDVDQPEATPAYSFSPASPSFGEILVEYQQTNAWVNTVAWSPSGRYLAFTGHASTAHFVDLKKDPNYVHTVNVRGLPFYTSAFVSDDVFVAAGWDNNPAIFVKNPEGYFDLKCYADSAESKKEETKTDAPQSSTRSAFAMFQAAASKAIVVGSKDAASAADKDSFTTHKNTIQCIRLTGQGLGFTTSGLDGKVVSWDASKYVK